VAEGRVAEVQGEAAEGAGVLRRSLPEAPLC